MDTQELAFRDYEIEKIREKVPEKDFKEVTTKMIEAKEEQKHWAVSKEELQRRVNEKVQKELEKQSDDPVKFGARSFSVKSRKSVANIVEELEEKIDTKAEEKP